MVMLVILNSRIKKYIILDVEKHDLDFGTSIDKIKHILRHPEWTNIKLSNCESYLMMLSVYKDYKLYEFREMTSYDKYVKGF